MLSIQAMNRPYSTQDNVYHVATTDADAHIDKHGGFGVEVRLIRAGRVDTRLAIATEKREDFEKMLQDIESWRTATTHVLEMNPRRLLSR